MSLLYSACELIRKTQNVRITGTNIFSICILELKFYYEYIHHFFTTTYCYSTYNITIKVFYNLWKYNLILKLYKQTSG